MSLSDIAFTWRGLLVVLAVVGVLAAVSPAPHYRDRYMVDTMDARFFAATFEATPDGCRLTRADGSVVEVHGAYSVVDRMPGYSR